MLKPIEVRSSLFNRLGAFFQKVHEYLFENPLKVLHRISKKILPIAYLSDFLGCKFFEWGLYKKKEVVCVLVELLPRLLLMTFFLIDILCFSRLYYFYIFLWLPLLGLTFKYITYCIIDFTHDFINTYEGRLVHHYAPDQCWYSCKAYVDLRFLYGVDHLTGAAKPAFTCFHAMTPEYAQACLTAKLGAADSVLLIKQMVGFLNEMANIQLFPRLYNDLRYEYRCFTKLLAAIGYLCGWLYMIFTNSDILQLFL